jgi:hypothetical protein
VIYSSRWFAFDIPDEWMAAAGMRGFVPRRTEYRARPHGNAGLATIILLVDDIGVARRGAGVPDLDRDRMVSVLSAIRLDQALPPVEVVEDGGERRTHRLYHGRHRVAASIAVRFPRVPAVIVRDLDDIKREERTA